jgi:hypothetical protein
MGDKVKPGDLLFLTDAFHKYMSKKFIGSKITLTNRLAKLEEIIDWRSVKGKKIKAARIKSQKWKDLPIEENKYIVSVYYHDLIGRKGQEGVIERGVAMFRYDPKSGKPFFVKVPDWIFKEINKKCEVFMLELKE